MRAEIANDRDTAGIKALVEQVCRVADRLEVLDQLHSGQAEAWLRAELGRIVAEATPAGERKAFRVEVTVKIDGTVAEERQQSKLLASLLSDIYRERAKLPPALPTPNGAARTSDLDPDNY